MLWTSRLTQRVPLRAVLGVLVALVAATPFHAAAAADIPGYVTTAWKARDGAPGDIRAMAQTTDGWLWLGTSSGLFRFDGRSFAAHDLVPETFPGRRTVTDIAALPDGRLVVVYGRAVIMLLAADGVSVTRPGGLPTDGIDGVIFDGNNRVFATSENKLFVLDGDHWVLCQAPAWRLPNARIDGASIDAEGAIIANTTAGVYRLATGSTTFERIDGIGTAADEWLIGMPDGRVWRTSDRGFELLPGIKAGRAGVGSGSSIFSVDGRGGFWSMVEGCPSLCLRRDGLDPAQGSMGNPALDRFPRGHDGLTAMTILSDRSGVLWAGGKEGLVRFQPSEVHPVDLGYEAYYFTMMPLPDGSMLVGSASNWRNDDLLWFTRGQRAVLAHGVHTHAVARWPDGRVLVVARDGPVGLLTGDRLVPWSSRPEKAKEALTLAALPADDDRAWISVEDLGLFLVSPNAWTLVGPAEGFPTQAPSTGATSSGGPAWFGYADGKVREAADGRVVQGAVYDTGLGAVAVVLPGKPLIVGGEQGIAWFDGKAFHPIRLRIPDTLRGTTGLARTPDGALWAYSRAGLVRIDANELKAVVDGRSNEAAFRILTEADGLAGGAQQSRSFTSLEVDAHGTLWAAGAVGLVTVDPATVKARAPVRPVILSVASGHHGPLPQGAATLAPDDASLEVSFTTLSLSDPKHVQLRYRLRGSDDTWRTAEGANTVRFDKLAPGTYQFELQARGTEGEWSPVVASPSVVRTPALTETLLFRCFIGFACLAGLFALYRLRVRAIRHRHNERTRAKLAERDRIASELHDSILQGTQAIALRLSGWEIDANVPETMRERIKVVSRQMRGIVLEGRARVLALRSVGQGGMSLSRAVQFIGEDHAEGTATGFQLNVVGEEMVLPDATQVTVIDILREAIHNAFLHASAGMVEVTIDFSPGTLRVTVRDDGIGLPAEVMEAGQRHGHWGLVIMRERAIGAGATFDIASGTTGTSVTLVVAVPGDKKNLTSRNVG